MQIDEPRSDEATRRIHQTGGTVRRNVAVDGANPPVGERHVALPVEAGGGVEHVSTLYRQVKRHAASLLGSLPSVVSCPLCPFLKRLVRDGLDLDLDVDHQP